MIDSSAHSNLSVVLDVADKAIKLIAVMIGGAWTWWNYRKSRTYAQKLEIDLSGSLFLRDGLYVEVSVGLKNIGASRHLVQQAGTACELVAIRTDLTKETVQLFPVFSQHEFIEPGEAIHDLMQCKLELDPGDIVWIRLDLRIVSGSVEWRKSSLVRVEME